MESKCLLCGFQPLRSVHLQDESIAPFHHLAVCNFPPTDQEISDIQTTILPDIERDITAISTTIDAARAALQFLEQQRDALNDVQQSFQNIISIQRRIPQEIWSEIFLYAHPSNSDKNFFNWPFRSMWNLSQVCHTWRNLALSLHSCWSSIVLDFSSGPPPSERDVKLLDFFLKRSHQHVLDVTLKGHNTKDLPVPLWHMRERVFAESHRWRTVQLVEFYQARLDLRYALLRGRMPLLERLDLVFLQPMDAVISAFMDCPRLVHVTLSGADPRMLELPAKQLTSLYLRDGWPVIPFSAYEDVLSQGSSLKVLVVSLERDLRHPPPLPGSLTLPSLRDLTATEPDFLDSLRTLSRLEVAALDGRKSLNPNTLYSFYHLIQCSNCASNLAELRFFVRPLSTVHRSEPHLLLTILSQTVILAALKLEASVYWDNAEDDWCITQIVDIMRALEIVPGETVAFLPRLLSLDVKVRGHTGTDGAPYLEPHDSFIAMLKARHAGNEGRLSRLQKFHFVLCKNRTYTLHIQDVVFNDNDTSGLHELCKDGMDLIIQYHI